MRKLYRALALAVAFAAAFLPSCQRPVFADTAKGQITVVGFMLQNFTSTNFTYCMSQAPVSLDVMDPGSRLVAPVTTSGSSTTITSFTLGTAPFNPVQVGDIILFNLAGSGAEGGSPSGTAFLMNPSGWVERVVTAKASGDSITVDVAIDLSGAYTGVQSKFAGYWPYWRQTSCGTDTLHGWFPMHNMQALNFVLDMTSTPNTLVGGVNYNLQCIIGSHINNPETLIGPINVTTFPTVVNFAPQANTATNWDYCRVGIQIGTSVVSTSFNLLASGVLRAE